MEADVMLDAPLDDKLMDGSDETVEIIADETFEPEFIASGAEQEDKKSIPPIRQTDATRISFETKD
jgi:hypothetical protein